MKSAILVIIALLFASGWAIANDLPKWRVVYAIIGEAEGEPYKGQLAVACAIQNRGTLTGVYGEKAPRVKEHLYSNKALVSAVRAYEESLHPENCYFIKGATHWEGTKFKEPYWAKYMVKTITIGNQTFYREASESEYEAQRDVERTFNHGEDK